MRSHHDRITLRSKAALQASSAAMETSAAPMTGYVTGDTLDYKLGTIGSALSPSALRAAVANLDRSGARQAVESTVDDYKMNEDIDAAYVQNKFHFDDWSLLAGVRAEHTSFKANGQQIDEDANLVAVQRQSSKWNLFWTYAASMSSFIL